jgi:hypothetical protein
MTPLRWLAVTASAFAAFAAVAAVAAEPLPPPDPRPLRPLGPVAADGPIPPSAPGAPALVPPAAARLPANLSIDDRPEPLTLAEVLESVRRHYPLLQAIERERGVAAGRMTTAMGAFDTNINMAGNALAPGTYENYRSDLGLSQMLQSGGIQVFGGYRTGFGTFPTYNLSQKTADVGEFRGGLTMPLARERDIDSARAGRD